MNIQILHSHLLEFLDTKASPQKVAECLSLCGPSVDRLTKTKNDYCYDIEITTNRVDTASVVGIAREAAAILPQFGVYAKFKLQPSKNKLQTNSKLQLNIKPDPKLNKRVMAAVLEVTEKPTPSWMADRLEAAGLRSKNILVDITNYIMIETGHPTHVFDYDKIPEHTLGFRLSKKGEKAMSFDGKSYQLPGNDIVIASRRNEIIDLPGIIGTKNSVVCDKTKRIIFFIDNNDPVLMRKTSLALNIRTVAVQLNEKSVDPELGATAMNRGISLYQKLADGKLLSQVFDFHPNPYRTKTLSAKFSLLNRKIGVEIEPKRIIKILESLGFTAKTKGDNFTVKIPSFRAHEMEIPEDIVEEVARIYGYFNLPNAIMDGKLPLEQTDPNFELEDKIKDTLRGFGGTEVYTLSLVSKETAGKGALKLRNPLGADTEYLRTTLKPSILAALKQNSGVETPFHLFEIANIYLPQKNTLPKEVMTLAGVFVNFDYRAAKGVLEALFETLNIKHEINLTPINSVFYYEFEVENLRKSIKPKTYIPAPKYPPQVEDMTIEIPEGKLVGEVIGAIKQASKLVYSVELVDVFERKFTFRISYLHPDKTLSDKEVERERGKITNSLS